MRHPIYIVGGGHAGIEAAFAISRIGLKSVIVTMDADATGRMSCNPAIGGLAKSHLVHEIDALGGIMSIAADHAGIQFKTLNVSKGRAVRSLRVQTDKKKYPKFVKSFINNDKNIKIVEGEVVSFDVNNNAVSSLKLRSGDTIKCSGLIITSGTFLNGLIHIGNKSFRAGRIGESSSAGLTEALRSFGFNTSRLKTGTPPRVLKKSIDWSLVDSSPGDVNPTPFSLFRTKRPIGTNIDSFSVNTNPSAHNILLDNLDSSPMFSGKIDAAGPRYCPSIEDKVVRFSAQNSHSLFLEPEWAGSDQIYLGGFSTSMPENVQIACLKAIKAFKNIEFIRPGYAIEYDYIPTYQLKSTLESKEIDNLYCAGQINGTSGYEEAAAQGLVAGANAALKILNKDPFVIKRDEGYVGVLIDDLVTKSINEPYRMFTSRAEYRLSLRPDNVYERLSKKAFESGLITKDLYDKYLYLFNMESVFSKKIGNQKIDDGGKKTRLVHFLKRPHSSIFDFITPKDKIESFSLYSLETKIKYDGYIKIEKKRAEKVASFENSHIPPSFNYSKIANLSSEALEKLDLVQPETIAQASRIDGVSRSDISSLCLFLHSKGFIVSRET